LLHVTTDKNDMTLWLRTTNERRRNASDR